MQPTNNQQSKTQKGFTLIELLVVIAIIGILAGMVVVNLSGATDSAKIAKSKVFSSSVRSSLLMNRVSEWNFDEGSGTAVADTVGTNNGILNNFNFDLTDGWRTGSSCVSEGCLQFDGADDYMSMGNQISLSGDYSVEAWVNIPSSASGSAARYLISFGAGSGSLPAFSPCYWTQYKPLIYLNGSSYRYGRTDLRDGKWHHIVFVVAGGEINNILNAKIYIDGKEESYYATSNTQAPIAPTGNGWMGGGSYPRLADGVRVYNKQLTISRIREEYLSGLDRLSAKGIMAEGEYEQRLSNLNLTYAENK
ncbi:MAG: LamG-like jellyroll fold domain-containing protein [Candidatus Paceibacterota bacterium]|jgi:prepilin-type N-terminal cleavage/methylation domain-containing protein